jgi:hypothetical protein
VRIGVDFDNTLVSYDELFHELAREQGLIPADLAVSKTVIRDYLRAAGREPAWTALQGLAYGTEIRRARPFPGALDFFGACQAAGVPVSIVSHKTRVPYLGQAVDLHAAARGWLGAHGFVGPTTGLDLDDVYFELTKEAKIERLAALGCTHFVDDLPEFLRHPSFPAAVRRLLFDPLAQHALEVELQRASSWREIEALLLCEPSLT